MRGKWWGGVAAALALTLALAGCGGKDNGGGNGGNGGQSGGASEGASPSASSSAPASAAGGEKIKLRMSLWGSSQMTIDKNDAVVRKFEEKYPNIDVEVELYTGDVYWDKMGVLAASNNLPDVIRMDYSQIKNYADKDLLLPLEPFVEKGTFDLEGIDPIHIDIGKIGDTLYGINIGNNAPVMFYNPELLEKAGVAAPQPGYSWEQYAKDIAAVKDKLGVYGDTHMGAQVFAVWLRQHGATLYNETQDKLGYADEKLFVDFFNQQLQWQDRELITPLGVELEVKALEDGPFAKGQAAFGSLNYWTNHGDIFAKSLGHPIGFAMYPGDPKGMYIKPSFFHSIAKSSKHPEEAALFIEFYTNSLEAARELNGYFGNPYNPKLIAGMQDILTDTQKGIIELLTAVEKQGSRIDPPDPAAGGEVTKLFKNVSDEIFFGKISPEEGAAKFREQAEGVLARQK